MGDVTKIVHVAITRDTSFPSIDAFGTGAIMSRFTPGNLNTPMQGANGRYKLYTSLKTMEQDGWTETDPIYLAARTYYEESPNPGKFFVGLRKTADANWPETLDAIQADSAEWYGFSCIFNSSELDDLNNEIDDVGQWTEGKIKMFGISTAQKAAAGDLVLLTKGSFTSGKLGSLENFQMITKGQFKISKDDAATVVVKDINMSASATAGEWETGSIAGNLANFQSLTDGSVDIALDGAAAVTVTGIDTSAATDFATVASLLQTDINNTAGLEDIVVTYDSAIKKLILTSGTLGAASAVILTVDATGTDILGANYLNGGESEPGKAADLVADYDGVAANLEAAIIAAGVTGVTVVYSSDDLRIIFTSGTEGKDSAVKITAITDQVGEDLTAEDYLNGGVAVYGTDLGKVPGTDDLGTFLKGKYDRTFWMYHEKSYDADHIADADVVWINFAWMSQVFSYQPAEATWAFKNFDLNRYIEVSEADFAQTAFVEGNYGNTYTLTGGKNVTVDGTVCGGEYLDIMRGTDWLQALLVQEAYKPLHENPRVPFTDGGIGLEENAIRGALTQAAVFLINDGDTVLTVPVAADVPKDEKARRKAEGFSFSSTYQGAIQKVGITGTIGL